MVIEDQEKYKNRIEQFLRTLNMNNEILFEAIVSCSELLYSWANNIKTYASTGDLGAMAESLKEIRNTIDRLELTISEAGRRARDE